jgi:lysyl-tRNA synthetase class 2
MKKLLAAGEEKIFTFSRVWRNREGGPRHRVEFTMLEWYRANEGYETLMDDCAAILSIAADAADVSAFRHGDTTCDPRARPRRTTVASEAMRHGVDLLATLPGAHPTRPPSPRRSEAGIATAPDDTWSDLFTRLLTERIEPNLGPGPVILDAYPAPEAALARRQPGDNRLAERFELFACGLELANAFGELTDADRTTRPVRGRHGPARGALRRPPAPGRGLPRRPRRTCPPPRAARSASTGW